ncbi:MAG: alpha/beta hydrolase [Rhodobacteraceae bacterium]|nr:alpha/beta hydrolase [Paracoccaceae bacterium]
MNEISIIDLDITKTVFQVHGIDCSGETFHILNRVYTHQENAARGNGMLYWQRQGTGPEIVLVHGFLGSSKIFEPLTEHLAHGFSVTTIDLPGFAGSHDVMVPPTVEELSQMVGDTIQSSGLTRYSILGHSLGAMIALELSLQRPNLLEKMVLYGGCPDGHLPGRFETTEESIEKIRSLGIGSVAADIAAQWFQRGKDDPMYPLAKAAAGGAANEAAAILHLETWDHWKARERLGEVQTPTLIICGDCDRSTHPDLSIEMWKGIPRSQLFIAPNAGHIVHLEYIKEFNSIVEKFLR